MASSLSDILTTIQQGVQALNNLGQRLASPWTTYTPTLTALAGSFTAATVTGRYKTIGKTVFVTVRITITTAGTANYPIFSLPLPPLNVISTVLSGVEHNSFGRVVSARTNGGSAMLVAYYDNTPPSTDGTLFVLTGIYEAA